MALTLTYLAVPLVLEAQTGVPKVRLGSPAASLAAGFTSVGSLVELSDGRIIITDQRERRLVVADFGIDAVRDIGRTGEGPGEYRSLSGAYPLRSDSVLVSDELQGRALIVVQDRIVETIVSRSITGRGGSVVGADTVGSILFRVTRPPSTSDRPLLADSVGLLLADRLSGRADTAAIISTGISAGTPLPTRPTSVASLIPVLWTQEQELLFPDGWLALARLNPYRVDWRSPDGQWRFGSPLPFDKVEIDDRERESIRAYLAMIGQPDIPLGADWPATAPPFLSPPHVDVLVSGPDGLLLIKRMPTATRFVNEYDVVDRSGAIVARIELDMNRRIVGFGRGGLYVVSLDDFGLEHVHRYQIPRLP